MPLESCMLVLDNSEYMRNGDYTPTRFQAQSEAVSTVFTAKTDSNPESAVGLMTMAGKAPSLLVTPTNDIGKLLHALGKSVIGGTSDLPTSVQIAQLALKHRENKNQRQRIVVFVGSPVEDTEENLVKLGKKLRKNNVLIDLVTFGDEGMENDQKLAALVEAAGGGESHLVSVPPGPHLLSDVISSSAILFDSDRPQPEGAAEGGNADGLDPNMDPELAMAIRMSLQEEEERQRRAAGDPQTAASASAVTAGSSSQPASESTSGSATALPASMTQPIHNANDTDIPMASGDSGNFPSNPPAPISSDPHPIASESASGEDQEMDEEEMLRQAMALSRGDNPEDDVVMAEDGEGDEEEDEEEAIKRAIAMSLDEAKDQDDKEKK